MSEAKSTNTSFITILSSPHGELRRAQRDIDKRDLQLAVKHGSCEGCPEERWRLEYDGIVYITDQSKRREITSYPAPLPEVPIDLDMTEDLKKATQLFAEKPELSTSHTVIVIDNSGSMLAKKNDIHLYRDSQQASFSMLALDFVAEQIFTGDAVNSDLLSLILFSHNVTVPIQREPIAAWPVYNKLLSYRNNQTERARREALRQDERNSQSNFLPALDTVCELFDAGYHPNCAVSLFFYSDGQSTDHTNLNISASEAKSRMRQKMTTMASRYGDALTVSLVGLGDTNDDFSVLEELASSAKDAGAKSSFKFCDKTANSISSAISSMVSSTTETRTALKEARRRGYTTREDLKAEKDAAIKNDWQYNWISDHLVYDPSTKRLFSDGLLPLAAGQSNPQEASRRADDPPPYLAVNRNYFGKGAERVAFRCRLSDSEAVSGFTFDRMVAKETKDVERIDEKIKFHQEFLYAQDLADYLAQEFNKRLCGLPQYDPIKTPIIKFLDCSILLVDDAAWPMGKRGVLVEKMLDTESFKWTKWNDNNEMVDGKHKHIPIDVDFELKQLEKEKKNKIARLGAVTEEDEDEDSDDDESLSDVDSDNEEEEREETKLSSGLVGEMISAWDYLQAYTHFTYRFTSKKVMVCDLQGIFNT